MAFTVERTEAFEADLDSAQQYERFVMEWK